MIILTNEIDFPDPALAHEDGLLAIGGDLSVERLVLAYKSGIFPWYSYGQPILWWSPDPRFVLYPEKLRISKSMRQVLRKSSFKVTFNEAFNEVITACAQVTREGQEDTWLTKEMIEAYNELYSNGYARSVEVWQDNQLVGGLYGVDVKNGIFCGESMFAKVSNASKVALIHFIQNSQYKLIDCQIQTNHLESLGAEYISRKDFLKYLNL